MKAVQVQATRDRVARSEKKAALAREFGVTRQTIYNQLAASITSEGPRGIDESVRSQAQL